VSPEQPSVAFLGTGIMGEPMAANIAKAGLPVRAWNRTREKAEPLTAHGATVVDTPADAVEGADIVVTMLADGPTVESVMSEGGALDAMRDDAVWIQTSTVGIDALERLAQLAEQRGVQFVDAPVSGTKQPAEQGKLTVLASGPEGVRDACTPIFDAVAQRTIWVGEAGSGTRLKLVINNWLLGLMESLAETIAFAERIGVAPEAFLDAIDGSPVGAPYARLKGDQILAREFPAAFPLSLALKDANLVLEAAQRHGISLPVAQAAAAQFKRAEQLGHGDKDMGAVYYASADGP
jgi:3-hydroxyisobutyrate dehydrogenase